MSGESDDVQTATDDPTPLPQATREEVHDEAKKKALEALEETRGLLETALEKLDKAAKRLNYGASPFGDLEP